MTEIRPMQRNLDPRESVRVRPIYLQGEKRLNDEFGVGHEFLAHFLERRIVVDDHLAEARKGRVATPVHHLVGVVE